MAQIYDLITRQDIEAFVDNQLTDARTHAVERRLMTDDNALWEAFRFASLDHDLRKLAPQLLTDSDLAAELRRLKAARRAA